MDAPDCPSPALSPEIDFTILEVPTEVILWCEICLDRKTFLVDRECVFGLVGTCAKCGDERVAPFSRATSEIIFREAQP